MKRKLIAGILALALGVATAFALVAAQTNSGGPVSMGVGGRVGGPCEMSQLTDEEQEEIQQQLLAYRQKLLEQYGINLTEEQRGEIRQAMQEKRQEMEEFRQELFAQYGIDLPEEGRPEFLGHCGINLTDEERRELEQQLQEFRQELFAQYGIDLTDEEREEIRQQMEEYKQELFELYGVSCPADPQFADEGCNGPRGRMGRWMQGFQRDFDFSEFPPTPPYLEI